MTKYEFNIMKANVWRDAMKSNPNYDYNKTVSYANSIVAQFDERFRTLLVTDNGEIPGKPLRTDYGTGRG